MKRWKHKIQKVEEYGIYLSTHEQKGKWYLYSDFCNHMIGYKSKFSFLKWKSKGNLTFGNNALAQIKGKGIVSLDENTKKKMSYIWMVSSTTYYV